MPNAGAPSIKHQALFISIAPSLARALSICYHHHHYNQTTGPIGLCCCLIALNPYSNGVYVSRARVRTPLCCLGSQTPLVLPYSSWPSSLPIGALRALTPRAGLGEILRVLERPNDVPRAPCAYGPVMEFRAGLLGVWKCAWWMLQVCAKWCALCCVGVAAPQQTHNFHTSVSIWTIPSRLRYSALFALTFLRSYASTYGL